MPSAYDLFVFLLEPADLQGKSHALTIKAVDVEEVYNPRAKRTLPALVVTFEHARKHMKLNKTQCAALIKLTGTDDYSQWPGARVILTPADAPNGRQTIVVTASPVFVDEPDDVDEHAFDNAGAEIEASHREEQR